VEKGCKKAGIKGPSSGEGPLRGGSPLTFRERSRSGVGEERGNKRVESVTGRKRSNPLAETRRSVFWGLDLRRTVNRKPEGKRERETSLGEKGERFPRKDF